MSAFERVDRARVDDRARHAAVRLSGHVGHQLGTRSQIATGHCSRAAAGPGEADDRGGRRPARRGPRPPRAGSRPAPPASAPSCAPRARRRDRRTPRSDSSPPPPATRATRPRRRRVDPAKERRVPVAHRMGQHVPHHRFDERIEPSRALRDRQRQQLSAHIIGHRLPDRPLRAAQRDGRTPHRPARGRPAGTPPHHRCRARDWPIRSQRQHKFPATTIAVEPSEAIVAGANLCRSRRASGRRSRSAATPQATST